MIEEPLIVKKKKKKLEIKSILISLLVIVIGIFGISYAFFNYYGLSNKKQEIIAGEMYLNLTDGTSDLTLETAFPETKEEARKRTDNVITFDVTGKNTSENKNVYYEIMLNEGNEEAGKTRFKPEHLVFDLIEVIDNKETRVVDAVSYDKLNNTRIWVNTVNSNTDEDITITYKLRMWLSEDVIISDTESYADYTTDVYRNSYASVKVKVSGDLKEKNIPLTVESDKTMVENNQAYFIATVTNDLPTSTYSLTRSVINDVMNLKITGTDKNVVFSYKDSLGNVVTDTSETLDLTYNFNKKTTVEVQVFVIPKNDANASTDVKLVLTQNGQEVQTFNKRMNVYGNNFCLNNGFNKLYDCILASDSLATNVSTAISNIEAKGEPNLADTAPTYTYVEQETTDVANVYSKSGYKFYFGDSYEFNSTNGTFRIYNKDGSSVITDYLSDTYKNYYTCGYTVYGSTSCGTIYRIDATSVDGTKYTITQGDRITYKVATSIRSEVGLYKTEDDYGDSYFYRGDVTNNNVLFGGYYWKIIRTNGDNSIRLIYNGTTPNATGYATAINNTSYTYSQNTNDGSGYSRYTDPTFVGYMYGKNFKLQTSAVTTYYDIVALNKYYFADGYEFDEEKEVFKLKKVNLDPVSGTFTEMKDQYGTYPYSCRSTSAEGVCQVLLKVDSWVNETAAKVQYISYSSVDKDSTRTNELSSNIKTKLEDWYETNIVGKTDADGDLITNYIVDGTFCNDRSTPNSSYNSGYLLTPHTYYGAYTRLTASTPTANLKCSNDIRDKFSHTTAKGNGLLEYPVALITADEVALAGGLSGVKNENYYLRTDAYYWTMSPSSFSSLGAFAYVWLVVPTGALDRANVTNSIGGRAVINLRSDVLISQGDGTMENPYVLKLA